MVMQRTTKKRRLASQELRRLVKESDLEYDPDQVDVLTQEELDIKQENCVHMYVSNKSMEEEVQLQSLSSIWRHPKMETNDVLIYCIVNKHTRQRGGPVVIC